MEWSIGPGWELPVDVGTQIASKIAASGMRWQIVFA
jgi:hypothetical protein